MDDKIINPFQTVRYFIDKASFRKKMTIRILPYAVVFAVIIVYTFAGEIGDMIASIQEETRNAVESMESATKEVDEGTALANQADASLKQIVESVQNVMNMVQQIAASARQQDDTGETVTSSLQSIADDNMKTAKIAEEYFGTTKELFRLSSGLRSLITGFRTGNGSGLTE